MALPTGDVHVASQHAAGALFPAPRRAVESLVERPLPAVGEPGLGHPTEPVLAAASARGRWLRTHGLAIEVVCSSSLGLLVGGLLSGSWVAMTAIVLAWSVSAFHAGRAVTSPLARQLWAATTSLVPALAFAGLMVGFAGLSDTLIRDSVPAVVSAGGLAAVARSARWRLQGPVRVVAIGDRIGVAQAIERFGAAAATDVIGAVVVEADIDAGDIGETFMGVPAGFGLARAATLVTQWEADMVVVVPGPGFTSADLKRLQHMLAATGVTVGLAGVLDSVAPHRVRPGWVANTTVLDVRAPRPSAWVRGVKVALDRTIGAVLLVAFAPLVLGLMAAIRINSRGKALFRQTRVGRYGKHFTVYKLRTMVDDAEERKVDLGAGDDASSLLFKMRQDPRVTRLGRTLRRLSLDELPQLINVVKGDMSLVGPRPFLPSETEKMDSDAMRRLAVRPGITGLWQISGRSDLEWEESAWLDVYYADNWSLTGDLKILLQTIPAVTMSKGAY